MLIWGPDGHLLIIIALSAVIALLISTKRVPHQPALASASGSLVLLLANLKTGSPCGGRRARRGHIQERRGRRGASPHHAVEVLLLPMHHPDAVTANTIVGLMADMIWKSSCIVGSHVFKFCMDHVVLYSEADRFCQPPWGAKCLLGLVRGGGVHESIHICDKNTQDKHVCIHMFIYVFVRLHVWYTYTYFHICSTCIHINAKTCTFMCSCTF